MTLKLRFNEQSARHVFELFNTMVLPDKPTELEDKLIMLHMLNIYRKLRAKLEGGYKYNINVSEAEALAYWCYFRYKEDLMLYEYEQNVIHGHILEIDERLNTRLYTINPNKTKLLI